MQYWGEATEKPSPQHHREWYRPHLELHISGQNRTPITMREIEVKMADDPTEKNKNVKCFLNWVFC